MLHWMLTVAGQMSVREVCLVSGRFTHHLRTVTIVSRTGLIAADAIVLGVTWTKMYRGWREGTLSARPGSISFGNVLFYNGQPQ